MPTTKPQFYFIVAALAIVFILSFFILLPFLYALIFAMVFASLFHPIYRKLLISFNGKGGIAAVSTILIIIFFIFTPITFLGVQVLKEAHSLYSSLTDPNTKETFGVLNTVAAYFNISLDVEEYVRQGLRWFIQHLGSIFGSIARIALNTFVFLIALYYLLKDGQRLKQTVVALSPLSDTDDETISQKLGKAINSVIRGNLLIALIQGVLTSIGFIIFGIPNPVLWGTLAAVAALIPSLGTSLVILPAVIYLFATGSTLPAVGLIIWGVLAVGLVDNILGPRLVGMGTKLHPLIILLSVLGGIVFFGPAGFILGPLTISLLFALIEVYSGSNKLIKVENKV